MSDWGDLAGKIHCLSREMEPICQYESFGWCLNKEEHEKCKIKYKKRWEKEGDKIKMNVLWLSANEFGFQLLQTARAIEGINVMGIITLSEDSKTVMYDKIFNEFEGWEDFGIPVYKVDDINYRSPLIKDLHPDLVIVAGWRQFINKEVLKIPRLGFIGFHPTLLPQGRGPAPIINTILEGKEISGVTLFHISEDLDAGDIIGQSKFLIFPNDHALEVYNSIIHNGKELLEMYLPMIAKGRAPRVKQDESKATYSPKRTVADNKITLEETPEEIDRKIRAFSKPYLGAYFNWKGKKLRIWRCELE